MNLDFSLLLLYVFSVFTLVATPGPVVALILNTSLRHGARRAALTALGSNAASLILALLAVLILRGGLALDPRLLHGISLLGCGFIGYLGLQGLAAARQPGELATVATRGLGGGLGKGFAVGIANPKDILFFVAFFPQFIGISPHFGSSVACLVGFWVLIDCAVLAAYIALARQGFALQYQRLLSGLSSLVLLAVALMGAMYSGLALSGAA